MTVPCRDCLLDVLCLTPCKKLIDYEETIPPPHGTWSFSAKERAVIFRKAIIKIKSCKRST